MQMNGLPSGKCWNNILKRIVIGGRWKQRKTALPESK